jgi:hypothetical protein
VSVPVRVSPGCAGRGRRPSARCPASRRARPRPPAPVRSNRRRRALRTNLAAPARPLSARRRCAFRSHHRQARSGASLEVCVPFSTSRLRRVTVPVDADHRMIPLRRSRRRPLRAYRSADFDGVRPCGFALEAARFGVGRCGGRSRRLLRLPVLRPEGGSAVREDFDRRHVFGKPRRARHRAQRHWSSRDRGYPIHISRRHIAPSCPGRVIRRGRFSHATFRTRLPGLRSLAGRLGFFPRAVRAALMGLSPFAGLLPIGGWTRGTSYDFGRLPRSFSHAACGVVTDGTRQPPESLRIPRLNGRRASDPLRPPSIKPVGSISSSVGGLSNRSRPSRPTRVRSRAFRAARRSLTRALPPSASASISARPGPRAC